MKWNEVEKLEKEIKKEKRNPTEKRREGKKDGIRKESDKKPFCCA